MEENEINITYNIIKHPNNQITITSDVDETPDYLSTEERSLLVIKHMEDLFKNLFDELESTDDDNIIDDDKDKIEEILEIRSALINVLLNISYNLYASKFNKKQCSIQYAMAIFKEKQDKDGDIRNIISNTSYSDDLDIGDPAVGASAFILDVAETLLLNGMPKNMAKSYINDYIDDMKENLNEFIETFEEDD